MMRNMQFTLDRDILFTFVKVMFCINGNLSDIFEKEMPRFCVSAGVIHSFIFCFLLLNLNNWM